MKPSSPLNPPERRPQPKGWCPGAHRAMTCGDGLLLRVRPRLGRLSAVQALGLCELAQSLGSGHLDLTNRASLQLRAIAPRHHGQVVEALCGLGLLDADPRLEARPAVLVQPLWSSADTSERIATELISRLGELPVLPAKFGFAVDAGPAPLLSAASADVRIERDVCGQLMVRADGAARGTRVEPDQAVSVALRMAAWFARDAAASGARRMREHLRSRALPGEFPAHQPAAPCGASPAPGVCAIGAVYGVALGQLHAAALVDLLHRSGTQALRLTASRSLILEGAEALPAPAFISRGDDALLGIDACAGAPACASATVPTRALARELASRLQVLAAEQRPSLHVSGCAKGCARGRSADVTLVGRDGVFDVVLRGCAWDAPSSAGRSAEQIRALSWSS